VLGERRLAGSRMAGEDDIAQARDLVVVHANNLRASGRVEVRG
jgi:hypothetical protein